MNVSSHVVGALEAARAFNATASIVQARTAGLVAYHGKQYQAAVRRRASGRPGPNIITRDYWKSIEFRMVRNGVVAAAEVYSDHPASRRLEWGYVGEDAAGRAVNAPPYPHWDPDFQATADSLTEGMVALVDSAGASHLL